MLYADIDLFFSIFIFTYYTDLSESDEAISMYTQH